MASWGMSTTGTLHRPPRRPGLILGLLVLSQVGVACLWWRFGWQVGLPVMVATHLMVVAATLHPRATLFCPALARLPTTERVVWLTIDDGPSDDTDAMLELLDRHRARATFFLVGERARAHPARVQAIRDRGHGIGNHSCSHPQAWFWALGPRRMRAQIEGCQRQLQAITGAAPRWFRAVVGHANPFVSAPLRDAGLARAGWSARGFDAVDGDVDRVLGKLERGLSPGAIVLLHEGAAHGRSVEIVEATLCLLEERGYATLEPPA